MKAKRSTEIVPVEKSSGNVFADIGLHNPEEHLMKAKLAARIAFVLDTRKLTQRSSAKLMGIDQPKVSALLRGKFSGYSTDRLLRFLVALGQDVDIVIRPKPKRQRAARIQVTAA